MRGAGDTVSGRREREGRGSLSDHGRQLQLGPRAGENRPPRAQVGSLQIVDHQESSNTKTAAISLMYLNLKYNIIYYLIERGLLRQYNFLCGEIFE